MLGGDENSQSLNCVGFVDNFLAYYIYNYDMHHSKADGSQFSLIHDSRIKNES